MNYVAYFSRYMKVKSFLLSLLFFPFFASSSPIYTFKLELTVDSILQPCESSFGRPGFGCDVSIGDKWIGFFDISTNPKEVVGPAFSSPFINMRLVTGDVYWDLSTAIQF